MMPLAVSTAVQIAYVIALVLAVFLGPVTVAEMKGQDILAGSSCLTMGVGPWIGASGLPIGNHGLTSIGAGPDGYRKALSSG